MSRQYLHNHEATWLGFDAVHTNYTLKTATVLKQGPSHMGQSTWYQDTIRDTGQMFPSMTKYG